MSRCATSSPAPANLGATPSRPEPPALTPAVSSPDQLSTDIRFDNRHQAYYEVVDKQTGNVLFEIPPEALREIGESLNAPLVGESDAHSLDVKS